MLCRENGGNAELASAKHAPVGEPSRSKIKQQTSAFFGAKPGQPHGDAAIVVNESQVEHTSVKTGNLAGIVTAGQAPEVAPLPAAQILLTRRWPGARQQPASLAPIALQPRLMSKIDVRCVKVPPGAIALHFGFALRACGDLSCPLLRPQQCLLG